MTKPYIEIIGTYKNGGFGSRRIPQTAAAPKSGNQALEDKRFLQPAGCDIEKSWPEFTSMLFASPMLITRRGGLQSQIVHVRENRIHRPRSTCNDQVHVSQSYVDSSGFLLEMRLIAAGHDVTLPFKQTLCETPATRCLQVRGVL